ncbi:MAG: SGNH/GDSL hydrolase family protein [Rhodospirillaceae bacterium]
MSKLKSISQSIALVVVSLTVMALLFEGACRLIVDTGMHYHLEMWKYAVQLKEVAEDPAIGHRHKAGRQAKLMGVEVAINEDGHRDSPVSQMNNTAAKILMLGDSITFGWGVPQDETVSARLEPMLTQRIGKPVNVLNTGVGNYNTAMEVAWFERYGLALKPDVVVLNVFINDAEPTPHVNNVPWWDRFLYSRVILFGALDTARRTLFGGQDWETYYAELYNEDAAGWRTMQASVRRLAALCQEAGLSLIIVDYPELRQLSPYPFAEISKRFSALADLHNVEYVALLPSVQGENPASLWVTAPDPHPNSYANKLFADYLADSIAKHLRSLPGHSN